GNPDRKIIGNPNPNFSYGLNSAISYKNFNFNILISGIQGNDILNYNLAAHADGFSFGLNQIDDVLGNYWTEQDPDPNAPYPKISSDTQYRASDRFIEDGSYLKVKSVKLSYTLKNNQYTFL